MSDALDRVTALDLVAALVQPDVAPTLCDREIETLVDQARLASTWAITTAYKLGDVIVPAVRNGHCYECVQPGTSRSTARTYADWPTYSGISLVDGNSNPQLRWQEAGADLFNPGIFGAEKNVYDINRAAREGWLLKARKASEIVDLGGLSLSEIRKHCIDEAQKFRPYRRALTLVRC